MAIIETGGKQYLVSKDTVLEVEKLEHKDGKVTFDKVLMTDDGSITKVGAPYVSGEKVTAEADKVYQALLDAGVEVLYDDRSEVSNGEKFADSDLVGIPWRVVVSAKTIEKQALEVKKRGETESSLVSLDEVLGLLGVRQ